MLGRYERKRELEVWETLSEYTYQSTKHPELRFHTLVTGEVAELGLVWV